MPTPAPAAAIAAHHASVDAQRLCVSTVTQIPMRETVNHQDQALSPSQSTRFNDIVDDPAAVQAARAAQRPPRRSSSSSIPKVSLIARAVRVSSSGPAAVTRPSANNRAWVKPGGISST